MSKKILFVTGAGSGMGQLAARQALDSGWAVAAIDVNLGGLNDLGDSASLLKLIVDITDYAAVQAAVEKTERELGPIDRMINAAAIMPLGPLIEEPRETIIKIMNIIYSGLVNVTHAVLPLMLARKRGEFVSFSSIAGHWPVIHMGAYNASKHAVAVFTEVLYHENRNSGVKFICVCPPTVATPLLKQAEATTWPKLLNVFPPITSESVLVAMERSLARGQFWCFPGPFTRASWLGRRFTPWLMWAYDHWVEKR